MTTAVGWFDLLERVGQRTGGGTLTAGVTPTYGGVGGAVNATLNGDGELTVALVIHKDRVIALSGSGSLATTATYLTTVSAAFTGGGTFSMLIDDGLRATVVGSVTGTPSLPDFAGNGTGSMTASWTQKYAIPAAMAGDGALTAGIKQIYATTLGLAGTGALAATTAGTGSPTATLTGSGVLSAAVVPKLVATPSGAGVLSATAILTAFRTAALTGTGALTATATPVSARSAALTATGVLTAVVAQLAAATAPLAGAGTMTALLGATGSAGPNMSGSGTLSATATQLMSFVTRDTTTGNLMLDGQRYRFAGNNWPGLGLNEDANLFGGTVVTAPVASRGSYPLHLSTHSEIDSYLDQCVDMNATVIRSFAAMTIGHPLSVQPTFGSFSSANLEPLDYAIAQCRILGIRMVLPLTDNYQYYMGGKFDYCSWNSVTPDGEATQFFTNTTVINSFKAHINYVLNHVNPYTGTAYKNEPVILSWETGNELGITATTTGIAWADNIAAHIKAQGAQQLVMDGRCIAGLLDVTAAQMPNIDILTQHPYNIHTGTLHYTASTGADAHTQGKAFVWGEWPPNGKGFPLSLGVHQNLQWTYDGMMSTMEGLEQDGDLLWALFPAGQGHEAVFTIHSPGDDAGMITRVAQFTAHAAAVPTLITTELLSDTMTGTNGTLLHNHVADSGSTWVKQAGTAGDGTIATNRVWFGSEAHYVSSGQPPSRNYEVRATVRIITAINTAQIFVNGRAVSGEKTMYTAALYHNAGAWSITLYRNTNGASVNIGSGSITAPTAGTDHILTLRMYGTQITGLWDGVSAVTGTDDWIRTAGKAGIGGINSTSTAGMHVDSIAVAEYTPSVTVGFTGAGSLSSGPSGPFVSDTFTASNGTLVTARAGEVGATWTALTNLVGAATIQTNRAWISTGGALVASATPPDADYEVRAVVNNLSRRTGTNFYICGRASSSGLYWLNAEYNASFIYLNLRRWFLPGFSYLEISPYLTATVPANGVSHSATLRMVGNQLSVYYNDVLLGGPYTNNDISTAGKAGFGGAAMSSTTFTHLESITAIEV